MIELVIGLISLEPNATASLRGPTPKTYHHVADIFSMQNLRMSSRRLVLTWGTGWTVGCRSVCRQSDKHTDTLSTKLRFHTRAENIASCHSTGQVCVQPRSSAVRMTLPAFAAERRAAASLLMVYVAPAPAAVGLYLRSLSSKPAACRCCCRLTGQKDDGQADAWPLHRPCSACYAGSANKILHKRCLQSSYWTIICKL